MQDVNVLVGLASEFKDADITEPWEGESTRLPHKLVPMPVFPDQETAFVTMAISSELFEAAEDRAELAEVIADAVAHKVRKLIVAGPGAVISG